MRKGVHPLPTKQSSSLAYMHISQVDPRLPWQSVGPLANTSSPAICSSVLKKTLPIQEEVRLVKAYSSQELIQSRFLKGIHVPLLVQNFHYE